jgi:hypothetical protein
LTVLYARYKHSVSAANLWRECPSAFLWRYGLQRWGKDNARIWMGKAAEAAYANALLHGLSGEDAQQDAVRRFYDASEGEEFPEAQAAGWIARGFVEQTDPAWGRLVAHNPWRPVHAGHEREISMKPDFVFENAIVDTKATLRLPSEPSFQHARQIAAYAREWKLPGVLFYSTARSKDKQYNAYDHRHLSLTDEQAEEAWQSLVLDWHQIDRFDRRFASVADAMSVTPLNTDSFYWEEDDIPEAIGMWMQAEAA